MARCVIRERFTAVAKIVYETPIFHKVQLGISHIYIKKNIKKTTQMNAIHLKINIK